MALTYSANSPVTDSAASGTALSSGYKTNNGFVGMTPEKEALRSIAEEARDSGRSVGIITTDSLTGATPAAFSAHVPSRGMASEIRILLRFTRLPLFPVPQALLDTPCRWMSSATSRSGSGSAAPSGCSTPRVSLFALSMRTNHWVVAR